MPFLVALIALPLIEIALFVVVGGWIGLWATLALVVGGAILGMWLIRRTGERAAMNLRSAMRDLGQTQLGQTGLDRTGGAVAGDALLMLAGILFIVPGFFSDIAATALLLPPVRRAITRGITGRVVVRRGGGDFGLRPHRPDTIDGEFHEIGQDESLPRRPSGWTQH